MIPCPTSQHNLNNFIKALNADGGISTLERYATDRFERRLRQRGFFTKFVALYLIIGGDAARHKFNFANPADSDAGRRLTFAGTVTHDANGMQGNGTTGYADTHWQPASTVESRRFGVHWYSRTNSSSAVKDWGHRTASILNYAEARNGSGNFRGTQYSSSALNVANTDSSGFFGWQRISDSEVTRLIRTGTVDTLSLATGGAIGFNLYLMADNNQGTAEEFSARQYCFFSITDTERTLTDTEQTDFRTDVTEFQTLLGRQ